MTIPADVELAGTVEIDGDAERVAGRMDALSRKLQAGGWERVVLVRSKNEQAHMLMKIVDRRICGMTVLVSEGESEAVVINLMGDIPPRQFAKVMTALEVDAAGVRDVQPANDVAPAVVGEQQG